MTLVIDQSNLNEIHAHGAEGYPNEICGFLLGEVIDGKKIIKSTLRAKNEWGDEGEHHNRFHISAQASFKAERAARKLGLSVLGCYHTHPDCPPVASETDLQYSAWPDYSFLILAVYDNEPRDVKSWLPDEDKTHSIEEPVEIID